MIEKQFINEGDFVYCPQYSKSLYRVKLDVSNSKKKFFVTKNDTVYSSNSEICYFDSEGKDLQTGLLCVYKYSPENKSFLEKLHSCKFESFSKSSFYETLEKETDQFINNLSKSVLSSEVNNLIVHLNKFKKILSDNNTSFDWDESLYLTDENGTERYARLVFDSFSISENGEATFLIEKEFKDLSQISIFYIMYNDERHTLKGSLKTSVPEPSKFSLQKV